MKPTVGRFYEAVACAGKVAHATKLDALRVLWRRKLKKDMKVYRCWSCGKWHIGQSALRIDK